MLLQYLLMTFDLDMMKQMKEISNDTTTLI